MYGIGHVSQGSSVSFQHHVNRFERAQIFRPDSTASNNIQQHSTLRNDVSSVGDGGNSQKNPNTPNKSMTYDTLVVSPDALPLSHMSPGSLVPGAKAI